MAEFYKFLASYEVLIYILLAIGALFAFRWLWRSWRESQTAVYSHGARVFVPPPGTVCRDLAIDHRFVLC